MVGAYWEPASELEWELGNLKHRTLHFGPIGNPNRARNRVGNRLEQGWKGPQRVPEVLDFRNRVPNTVPNTVFDKVFELKRFEGGGVPKISFSSMETALLSL